LAEKLGIALLGSTGSIGRQTLDVIERHPDRFRVVALAARSQTTLLEEQATRHQPEIVVADGAPLIAGKRALPTPAGLIDAALHPDVDIVVAATSGHDGIRATYAAIQAGKIIALSNKETIVCAGELVTAAARRHGAQIRPVDHEHSAIWQCLDGSRPDEISRLIITATGGPFRATPAVDLAHVTPEQALAHPTWRMGPKITIDSATLMNKGLEVLEARWLFDVPYSKIDVTVHPEAIIHSMVEFRDASIMAQLGVADMRLAIQHALTYPERIGSLAQRLDVVRMGPLTFAPPDLDRFPALGLARQAGECGQTYPTVLSAADEVMVNAFLQGRMRFTDIPAVIDKVLQRHDPQPVTDLDVVFAADRWARDETVRILQQRQD
jgi:1-deoxy-D-xylulose-5-phosphate reductoisomerase